MIRVMWQGPRSHPTDVLIREDDFYRYWTLFPHPQMNRSVVVFWVSCAEPAECSAVLLPRRPRYRQLHLRSSMVFELFQLIEKVRLVYDEKFPYELLTVVTIYPSTSEAMTSRTN